MTDQLIATLDRELAKLKAHLGDKYDAKMSGLEEMLRDLQQRGAGGFSPSMTRPQMKSLGEAAIEADQIQDLLAGNTRNAKVTLKGINLKGVSGDVGSPPAPGGTMSPATRMPGIIPGAQRQLRLRELLQTVPIDSNQFAALVEDMVTSGAASQASEGAEKGSTSFDFRLDTLPVRTIAHTVAASDQVLADQPALRSFLDARMSHFLLREEERQILSEGTGADLRGFRHAQGHTAFTPATGDQALDSIRRAKGAIEGADYMPNAVVLNSADWTAIELLKDTYGRYLLGAANFVNEGMTRRVWDLDVIVSNTLPAGKLLVADFMAAATYGLRSDVTVDIGWVNDQFKKNEITIRAEMRSSLIIHTPAAVRFGDLDL
ncbi:MAG: phage major capsid protein [Gammaproteobacteria bacterium]|nr:phage major capsid protein [Gammaproteobacteria bacterium]